MCFIICIDFCSNKDSSPDIYRVFDFMPEDEVIGHDVVVKVEWKTGREKHTDKIRLQEKPWYKR